MVIFRFLFTPKYPFIVMLPRRFFISVCQSLIYFPPQRGQMLEGTDRAVETIGGREGRHAQANCTTLSVVGRKEMRNFALLQNSLK